MSQVAGPKPTDLPNILLPICGVIDECLTNETGQCSNTDLKCICKIDNSLERNQYIDPTCVFLECYSDMGRRDWLDAFLYACTQVGNNITNVPAFWRPAVPEWYDKWLSTLPPPPPKPTSTTNSSVPNPYPPSTSNKGLSPAAVGGIAVTCALVFVGIIVLVVVHLKTRKKAKRKSAQVAVLQDQLSPHGFTHRIHQIWSGNNDSFGVARRDPEPITPRDPVTSHRSTNEYQMSPLAYKEERQREINHGHAERRASPYDQAPSHTYGQTQTNSVSLNRSTLSEERRPSSLYEADDYTPIKPLPYVPRSSINNYEETRFSSATTQVTTAPYEYPASPQQRDLPYGTQDNTNTPYSAEIAAVNPYHHTNNNMKLSFSGSRHLTRSPPGGSDAYNNLRAGIQRRMGESVSRTMSASAHRGQGESVDRTSSAPVEPGVSQNMKKASIEKVRDWL